MKERLLAWLKRLFPRYSWGPLLACLTLNLFAYYVPRLINVARGVTYHNLALPLDGKIPFVPAFIVVYVAAYVSWYLGYALICRERPENCGVVFGEMISKMVCMACFVALPTLMAGRPEVTGQGFIPWLTRLIFASDTPADNLFPSIHCMESWLAWRGMFGCRSLRRPVKAVFLGMALLVFASTLLVKQHVLVDIPAGILVGELGQFLSRRLRLGQRYARWAESRGLAYVEKA